MNWDLDKYIDTIFSGYLEGANEIISVNVTASGLLAKRGISQEMVNRKLWHKLHVVDKTTNDKIMQEMNNFIQEIE